MSSQKTIVNINTQIQKEKEYQPRRITNYNIVPFESKYAEQAKELVIQTYLKASPMYISMGTTEEELRQLIGYAFMEEKSYRYSFAIVEADTDRVLGCCFQVDACTIPGKKDRVFSSNKKNALRQLQDFNLIDEMFAKLAKTRPDVCQKVDESIEEIVGNLKPGQVMFQERAALHVDALSQGLNKDIYNHAFSIALQNGYKYSFSVTHNLKIVSSIRFYGGKVEHKSNLEGVKIDGELVFKNNKDGLQIVEFDLADKRIRQQADGIKAKL